MKSLKEYKKAIDENLNNPVAMAELGMQASGDYSYYSEIYMENELKKSQFFVERKFENEKPHSDAYLEKLWQQTEEGKLEIQLKYYMKALEKIMSMVKNNNYIQNVEARNGF